jgi:hypothetical protein
MGACEAAAAAACACTRLPPTPALTVASKRPASPVSMPSLKGMAYTGVSCDVREQPCTCSKQLRLHARRLPLKTPAATSSRARLQLFPPHTCSKPETTGNAAARCQPPPAHATQMTIPLIYAMTNADIKIHSDAPRRRRCRTSNARSCAPHRRHQTNLPNLHPQGLMLASSSSSSSSSLTRGLVPQISPNLYVSVAEQAVG